jgi:hypothetical protein
MPCLESDEEEDAPPPPVFTTPTKAISNDGACHAEPDDEGTEEILRRAHMYEDLVLRRTTEDQYELLDVLDLYDAFHHVRRETSWAKFLFGCICKWCCKWTICEHTALLMSVFNPEVQVPAKLVAKTQALCKKCSKVRGTAGPCKVQLLKQIAKQKEESVSKIEYVNAPVPPVPDAPAAAARCGGTSSSGEGHPRSGTAFATGGVLHPSHGKSSVTGFLSEPASPRPAALLILVVAGAPRKSSVFHRPSCHPTMRFILSRIQVSCN